MSTIQVRYTLPMEFILINVSIKENLLNSQLGTSLDTFSSTCLAASIPSFMSSWTASIVKPTKPSFCVRHPLVSSTQKQVTKKLLIKTLHLTNSMSSLNWKSFLLSDMRNNSEGVNVHMHQVRRLSDQHTNRISLPLHENPAFVSNNDLSKTPAWDHGMKMYNTARFLCTSPPLIKHVVLFLKILCMIR